MKRRTNIAKGIFFFAVLGATTSYTEQVSLSFDSLFPSSWFKKALDDCMQVWNDMQVFQEYNQNIAQDHILLFDVIVSRLVYVHFCLERMVKEKHKISTDDIVYLVEVVARIQRMSEPGESRDMNERMPCVQKVSSQIKLFLEEVLSVSYLPGLSDCSLQ